MIGFRNKRARRKPARRNRYETVFRRFVRTLEQLGAAPRGGGALDAAVMREKP